MRCKLSHSELAVSNLRGRMVQDGQIVAANQQLLQDIPFIIQEATWQLELIHCKCQTLLYCYNDPRKLSHCHKNTNKDRGPHIPTLPGTVLITTKQTLDARDSSIN